MNLSRGRVTITQEPDITRLGLRVAAAPHFDLEGGAAYLRIPLLGPCVLGTWGAGGVRSGLFGAVGAHASLFASGPAATGYLSGKAKARC